MTTVYQKLTNFSNAEKALYEFFQTTPFGRFLLDRKINFENSISFELENLKTYLEKGSIYLAYDNKDNIIGLIGFHYSAWDTEVFQKKMAFLQYFLVKEFDIVLEKEVSDYLLNLFHNWIKENQIKVVISKLDTQYFTPILTLQQNGYIFYECITYRSLEINSTVQSVGEGIPYRYANNLDNETLKVISLKNTFPKSHFYLDTNFDKKRVELMYSRWIENALKSKQKIVIVEDSNKIAGVFIYDIVDYTKIFNKKIGVWKSAFVDSNFRDKGIGLKLFKSTLQACIIDGVDIVDSTLVEKNIISQSFHDKLGFRLVNTLYTFHKWFD